MFVIEWIIEILFFTFFAWVGHWVVKLLTFGKVKLDYGDSSESVITACIGFAFILGVALLVVELIK
jgi:hypothetical protein